jgi:hypothetical protein
MVYHSVSLFVIDWSQHDLQRVTVESNRERKRSYTIYQSKEREWQAYIQRKDHTRRGQSMIPPVQSRPEPSSPVQVQSKKCLDWDRTDPRCWQTGLGLVGTDPSRCPGLGYTFPIISLLIGRIYLDGAEYTDRSGIISTRVGIRGWVVIKSEDVSCFR